MLTGPEWPALADLRLNPASPSPLYHQLYVALRQGILDGSFAPGSLLPSEQALSETLGTSRITVKRALNELSAHGLVVRERGRNRGTRVLARDRPSPVLASIDGLLENSLVMGKDTGVVLLEFDYVPADPAVAEALELAQGTPVQMAVRIRRTGSTPFSHLTTWLPESVGRSFAREELGTIPLVMLLERAGVRLTSAEQVIGAENATGAVAAALGIDSGTAVMTMVRTLRDEAGHPVEHSKIVYNPRLYQYRMMLERLPASSGQGWRSKTEAE